MTFDAAIVVATFIISATAIVAIIVVTRRNAAAKEEELRRQASMRGWTFERVREGAYRINRWKGSSGGVAWIAESLEGLKGNQGRGPAQRRLMTRWRTAPEWANARAPFVTAPIVCLGLPTGKEMPSFAVAQGDTWLAKLAQKAVGFAFDKAIDHYFGVELGREVDAAVLRRVEGAAIPGFIVMAADPEAASRILFQGLQATLTDATRDTRSILADEDRPWVLLWSKGVALARTEKVHSADELDRFIHAGLTLTRVPTFGRLSPS